MDYLLGVSDLLRQGGLRLRDAGDRYLSPDSEVPPLAQLPHLLALSRRVEDEAATLTELRNLLRAGSSLGGARPKANIRDGRSFKIAKFTSNMDTTSVVAWEYVCLDMAAAAGISVPGRRLVMVAGKPVLLLDRFDRTADGGRVGFISAMTVLRRRDGGSATYEELAYELETFIPSDVAAQKRELFKRIAFGLAVNNTDDHLRNHGFLRGDHHWRLSPMYDVTPSRDSVVHATPVDDADDGHNSVQCLTDLAELFDLSRGDVASIFEEILRATAGWRRRAAAAGMDGKEIEAHAPCFDSPLRSALAAAAG